MHPRPLHAIRIEAWVLTVGGCAVCTRNVDRKMKSKIIFAAIPASIKPNPNQLLYSPVRHKLIASGTSGRSKDLVASDTAVSTALVNAENADILTYPIDAALTFSGTNAPAS